MAAFLSGLFALASLALMATILLASAFDFLVSTLEVCFLTTAVILANAAFALAILALIAFFWAPGALRSFALSVATFLAITNYLRSAYFLLGSVAAAILASIFETLF
jgi:hypothetical protein